MDCFHTLSDEEEHVEPSGIREFLESSDTHGAAICQSSDDWSKDHTALEEACQKLGAACSYDIRKMIDGVNQKVQRLGGNK